MRFLSNTLGIGSLILALFVSANARAEDLQSEGGVPPVTQDLSGLAYSVRPLPPRAGECHLCHTKKSRLFIKEGRELKREHENIEPIHGRGVMSCNICHDINNHNYLRWSERWPADFKNSSPVCQRCHAEKYKDWRRGLHGKRLGEWKAPKEQWQCIDCHSPHSVKFKKMQSLAEPKEPRFLIKKAHGSEEH